MSKTKTLDECIRDFRKVHGDKYDYSKVVYETSKEKVEIVCPIHGSFYQTPNKHLNGRGCPHCAGNIRKTTEQCVNDFKNVHGDKYDYSFVDYVANNKKVKIICSTHGEFQQTPSAHLLGCGCPKCGKDNSSELLSRKFALGNEDFILKAKEKHKGLYSYDKTVYTNMFTNVIITCPIHGDFSQLPHNHLKGYGCPKCRQSKLEKEVENMLSESNIEFEQQKKFEWLGRQSLDFYLPFLKVAIECQGEQHFKPINHFGGIEKFNYTIILDKQKQKLCNENGVKLLYYGHNVCGCKDEIITDKAHLLEIIKGHKRQMRVRFPSD